ncbi:hypothetical protein HJC23_011284 [Cyclotella cryptica]|uniref:Uncharacterized protein n=1 Tax=Cyclotella cryptica TaxID=29204 RepID=A0ABD3QZ14_9STRA
MPSKVDEKRACSTQPTIKQEKSTPVKTKEEQLASAREYAKTLSPARKTTKKSPTRLTTPKKKALAATSPACLKTPLSKEEQLARAREYGMKLKTKNSLSPVAAHHTPVPAVIIQSDMSMSDPSDSGYETAHEPGSVGRKKVEAFALAELKRLAEQEEAIVKEEEAKAAVAVARAEEAKAKRDCLQAIIYENERMDCD